MNERKSACTSAARIVSRLAFTVLAAWGSQGIASELVFTSTTPNTDFAMFGQGGLRGNSSGSIVVSGISGTVTKALLLWHGPTITGNSSNSTLTFAGVPKVGTLIGTSSSNLWDPPFQESRAYSADVTAQVPGDGSYALTALANTASAQMNGASLLIFYDDGNAANNRDIALFLGNDSNDSSPFDSSGWHATLNGINYSSGTATMRLVVSDGQTFPDGELDINATQILAAGSNWEGDSVPNAAGSSVSDGGLWDQSAHDVTSFMTPGVVNLSMTSPFENDALSLIAVAFDLPAGSAPPPPPPPPPFVEPVQVPTFSGWMATWVAILLAVSGAAYARRRRAR
jgi:hypothetical protein